MIRLTFPSAEHGLCTVDFPFDTVRFGTDIRCEVCLRAGREVARTHGEFVEDDRGYMIRARDSRCLLWVDGEQVGSARLHGGERIRVGAKFGPEIFVVKMRRSSRSSSAQPRMTGVQQPVVASSSTANRIFTSQQPQLEGPRLSSVAEPRISLSQTAAVPPPVTSDDQTVGLTAEQVAELQAGALRPPSSSSNPGTPSRRHRSRRRSSSSSRRTSTRGVEQGDEAPAPASTPVLTKLPSYPPPDRDAGSFTMARFFKRPQAEVQRWLAHTQAEMRRARSETAGQGESSGQTMVIFANALSGLRQMSEGRARRWRRTLWMVAIGSVLTVAVLSGVIFYQQQRINQYVKEKKGLDVQINAVFEKMADETDPKRLAELEAKLQVLMGSASEKVLAVSRANAQKGGELAEPKDDLERDIRKLLRSFNAETYAIPPIFKETLQKEVAELAASPGLRSNYVKKQKMWPIIQQALQSRELPQELGYITFTESRFEPTAVSPVGAVGMWQLMPATARLCGLTVNAKTDERYDVNRSSEAAACYLSNLLVEFGQESFMLVLASYNRGENGVRSALHKVARDPGGWRKRDFWHLYRLKLLPDETRDYVPRILAAALVFENPEKYGLKPSKDLQ